MRFSKNRFLSRRYLSVVVHFLLLANSNGKESNTRFRQRITHRIFAIKRGEWRNRVTNFALSRRGFQRRFDMGKISRNTMKQMRGDAKIYAARTGDEVTFIPARVLALFSSFFIFLFFRVTAKKRRAHVAHSRKYK